MKRLLLAFALTACAAPTDAMIPESIPANATLPPAPPVVVEMPLEVVRVTTPAVRQAQLQLGPAQPVPSARDIVNGLPYGYTDIDTAIAAYRIVAAVEGWTPAKIALWEPFVRDVINGESGGCWNARGGDIFNAGSCVQEHRGDREDVGFGQATYAWYGRDALLCTRHGYCTSAAILASPYDSMRATIVLIIDEGGAWSAWCWSPRARNHHPACWTIPER